MNKGFQYFPEKLYSKPVRMSNISTTALGFGTAKPQEIFYTVKDGPWSDITTWETVSGRPGKLPTIADDVYIRHNVYLDLYAIVNNLFISGTFRADNGSREIDIYGNVQSTGIIDFTSSNVLFVLMGYNNYIATFICGATSTVYFNRGGDQKVLGLTYRNLITSNSVGIKYVMAGVNVLGTFTVTAYTELAANMTISGTLWLNNGGFFDLTTFDATITGQTSIRNGTLVKSGGGNVIFIGQLRCEGFGFSGSLHFYGNPTVECRNGILYGDQSAGLTFRTGTGVWSFTTNSQSLSGSGSYKPPNLNGFECPVLIVGAITLTNAATSGSVFLNTIDGTVASSTFTNSGKMYFGNTLSVSVLPMATAGVYNNGAATAGSLIGYIFDGSYTLPHTTYQSLTTGGTGTKVLGGNTTINANLSVGNLQAISGGAMDISTYSLTVIGTTAIGLNLYATGAGSSIIFGGLVTLASSGFYGIDFSSGNPTVELKGGIVTGGGGTWTFLTGTGVWTFSTNNQSISGSTSFPPTFNCPIIIAGAITLTNAAGTANFFLGTINGNNAGSTFDNRTTVGANYQSAVAPMVTGVLQTNAVNNLWRYNKAGAQDMKAGTYRSLTLAGSGAKKLLGNVSVINSYTLTGPATLDANGFALTNP